MEENTSQSSQIQSGRRLNCSDGSVIVKGVHLPAMLVRQLEVLGVPLESYSVGQLHDALLAVAADGILVDDHEAFTFEDMIYLSDEEKQERLERRQAFYKRNEALYNHLFADVRESSPDQLYNPWCSPRLLGASECDVADDLELVRFGHEHLYGNLPSPLTGNASQHEWQCDRDGYPILHHFWE